MTTTTAHYLGINVHNQEAQVAILDDEGEVVKKIGTSQSRNRKPS